MIGESEIANLYSYLNATQYIDNLGNNMVIIVGGINSDPYNTDTAHDKHMSNFYMAAILKALELNSYYRNETIEIISEKASYVLRKHYMLKNRAYYDVFKSDRQTEYISDRIKYIQERKDNRLVIRETYNSKEELLERLATDPQGNPRSEKSKISILYYYGHGYIGCLAPGFNGTEPTTKWSISLSDIPNLFRREYFTDDPKIGLITCHSATTSNSVNTSFAGSLSKHLGCRVKGFDGRVDYAPTAYTDMFFYPEPSKPKLGTTINSQADSKHPSEVMFDHGYKVINPKVIFSN